MPRKNDRLEKEASISKWPDLIHSFKTEICDRAKEIDPSEELDWYALSYGYFLAKGVPLDDVSWLAIHVRYDLHYWS